MTTTEQRLRQLADDIVVTLGDDFEPGIETKMRSSQGRHFGLPAVAGRGQGAFQTRQLIAAGLVAVVTAAAVAVAVAVTSAGPPSHQHVNVGATIPTVPTVPARGARPGVLDGKTTDLPAAPLAGRSGPASTWTGSQMLIWGGQDGRLLTDGASYTPATKSWATLPASPLSGRQGAVSAWTGQSWIIWGGDRANGSELDDGAVYTPSTRRWSIMTAPPERLRGHQLTASPVPHGPKDTDGVIDGEDGVWAGNELIVVEYKVVDDGGKRIDLRTVVGGYNPVSNRWRVLPSPTGILAFGPTTLVWTGAQVVMLGQTDHDGYLGDRGLYLSAFDPAGDTWTNATPYRLPSSSQYPDVVWDGHEVLIVGLAAWNPTSNTWRPLSAAPFRAERSSRAPELSVVWTGHLVLFWDPAPDAVAFDPSSDTWARFDTGQPGPRDAPALIWTGQAMIGWGGSNLNGDTAYNSGVQFTPTRSAGQ